MPDGKTKLMSLISRLSPVETAKSDYALGEHSRELTAQELMLASGGYPPAQTTSCPGAGADDCLGSVVIIWT